MPIARIGNKLVYFAHVPRAAGTSVERYLRARFGSLAFSDEAFLLLPEADRWTRSSPQHMDARAFARLFPPGFFDASFAIVRDPCHRLLSVYLRQRDIQKTIPPDTVFTDWLKSLPLSGYALDNHTRSMLDFIPLGARIFRLEDGLDQVVTWLDGLAGNTDGPREIGHFNGHDQLLTLFGRDPAKEPPIEPLDVDTKALIAQRYPADMYWCGYHAPNEETEMSPKPPERTIILHYHLFKNAGTSLDKILQKNFGNRWVTREFPMKRDNSVELAEWIMAEKDAVAFSTHTAKGPLPQIPGVRIVSIMLLRDPIARIRSVYQFERQQIAETFGALLAKKTDLEGYVRTRLERKGDGQCRNFQTSWLATMKPGNTERSELDRALDAAKSLTVVGSTADFDRAMTDLSAAIKPAFPDFAWTNVRANVSKPGKNADAISAAFLQHLKDVNSNDLALLEALFGAQPVSDK